MFAKIRPRRGTKTQWETANTVLAEGEIAIEVPDDGVGTGTINIKIGDGTTEWNNLPYASEEVALKALIGSTDISEIGDGTATGAISVLNESLGKLYGIDTTKTYETMDAMIIAIHQSLKDGESVQKNYLYDSSSALVIGGRYSSSRGRYLVLPRSQKKVYACEMLSSSSVNTIEFVSNSERHKALLGYSLEGIKTYPTEVGIYRVTAKHDMSFPEEFSGYGLLEIRGIGYYTHTLTDLSTLHIYHGTSEDNVSNPTNWGGIHATEAYADLFRHVWFSNGDNETLRAYDDNFMYNPATGILKATCENMRLKTYTDPTQFGLLENGKNTILEIVKALPVDSMLVMKVLNKGSVLNQSLPSSNFGTLTVKRSSENVTDIDFNDIGNSIVWKGKKYKTDDSLSWKRHVFYSDDVLLYLGDITKRSLEDIATAPVGYYSIDTANTTYNIMPYSMIFKPAASSFSGSFYVCYKFDSTTGLYVYNPNLTKFEKQVTTSDLADYAKIQRGSNTVSINSPTVTPAPTEITFEKAFSSVPTVMLDSEYRHLISAYDVTTTGFKVSGMNDEMTSLGAKDFTWVAFG